MERSTIEDEEIAFKVDFQKDFILEIYLLQ